jgi:hypothetical protein
MKTFIKISLLCIISFGLMASVSFAQEAQDMAAETEDMATEAEMYFASGSVVEATDAQIVISEYDFDAGQETNIAYQVNAQTQFEGVVGAADIKAGDDVEIEYQLTGEQKIATRVEKYAPEEDAEPMEAEGTETQAMETMQEETEQQLNNEGAAIETNN